MGYTPMMEQYFEVKKKYEDCILFYRLGDFYEMFFDDAFTASKELELTLTGRDCGMPERAPMCGVPFHSCSGYISKLVSKGYKVAICEQIGNPAVMRGIVRREVTKVVTPSTITEDGAVAADKNNFLASAYKRDSRLGLAFLDFSTGELYATVINADIHDNLITEFSRFMPTECLINEEAFEDRMIEKLLKTVECYVTKRGNDYFEDVKEINNEKFGDKCALIEGDISYSAIGAAIKYIGETQKTDISHIDSVSYYSIGDFMNMDANTRRNLEITETMRNKSKKGSLLWVIDKTETSMGGRRLRNWVEQPLINYGSINKRLDGVEEFVEDVILRSNVRDLLRNISDMERIIGKVVCGSANGRDLIALKTSFRMLPSLIFEIGACESTIVTELYKSMDAMEDMCELIEKSICDNPPVTIREGGIIRDNYSEELDEYRRALSDGKGWLAEVEAKEKEATGIRNLKVSFNKVFGYYIEVSKSNVERVPDRYIRKQTLTNGERYITDDLKKIEEKLLGASEKSMQLEYSLFEEIREKVGSCRERIQKTAKAIGILDCLASLAEVAVKYNYCKPTVDISDIIDIKQGRHPVVERLSEEMFVPNDTFLNNTTDRLLTITGPNMAGKSTYMRQVASIALLAQIGSFVPATSAHIGICDSIFTRVGASDDLAAGQSTFMVEMSEVASILKNATPKSLIIYDEIGRGTSTYDGLAIAWAVAEHTASRKTCGAKTLFATHYHELTELENSMEGVKNYSVAIKERGEDIIFLRKIVRGGADDSYGVEVAKLAGLPENVVKRARVILKSLEKDKAVAVPKKTVAEEPQMSFEMSAELELVRKIKDLDIDTLTPIEGLSMLYSLKKDLEKM